MLRRILTLVFFVNVESQFEMVGMVPKPVIECEIGELLGAAG